jgi:hypothetical protein
MYHSYHSWGEQFFTRWDYTATEVPPDHDELLALAWKAVNAINAVHNQTYEAGTSPVLMYPFSGSSADWSRGAAQIKYPYLQELRDANGDYAFVPPPTEIIPCGEENIRRNSDVDERVVCPVSGNSEHFQYWQHLRRETYASS